MQVSIEELRDLLDQAEAQGVETIEVHTQPNYPLKGKLANARILGTTLALAVTCTEYGSEAAWADADLDCACADCGDTLDTVAEIEDGLCECCGDID